MLVEDGLHIDRKWCSYTYCLLSTSVCELLIICVSLVQDVSLEWQRVMGIIVGPTEHEAGANLSLFWVIMIEP